MSCIANLKSLALLVLQVLKVCPVFRVTRPRSCPLWGKFCVVLFVFSKIQQGAKYQVPVIVFLCVVRHYSVQPVLKAKVPILHMLCRNDRSSETTTFGI